MLRFGFCAVSLVLAASFSFLSYAQDIEKRSADAPEIIITDKAECEFEGGSMVPLKGNDYCLVPIRPQIYQSEKHDGEQLGVINCPGNTLNDEVYCLYPVMVHVEPSEHAEHAEHHAEDAENADAIDDDDVVGKQVSEDE